jgi:hypothetical protein
MDREKAGIDHTVLRATRAGVDRPDQLVQCAGGSEKAIPAARTAASRELYACACVNRVSPASRHTKRLPGLACYSAAGQSRHQLLASRGPCIHLHQAQMFLYRASSVILITTSFSLLDFL